MLITKHSTKLAPLAVVAVLAGCGSSSSSSGVSAGAYVKSVCTAIGPFEQSVASHVSALNPATLTNPAQGKTTLQNFLASVVMDSDKAVNELKAAGTPNVANGKAIATGIVSAFSQLKGALTQASSQASTLPTSSPAAFKTAANTLASGIQTSLNGIGSSLGGLKNKDLETAAAKEPTCKSLASG